MCRAGMLIVIMIQEETHAVEQIMILIRVQVAVVLEGFIAG